MSPRRGEAGTIHLVRHAKAESRRRYDGDDRLRPLTLEGQRQAEEIARRLGAGAGVDAVFSSAATRCAATVAPLAKELGLPLGTVDSLMEGSDPLDALDDLLTAAAGSVVVACSHGDVIFGILEAALQLGVELDSPLGAPKASTWELGVLAGGLRTARFVPAPQARP